MVLTSEKVHSNFCSGKIASVSVSIQPFNNLFWGVEGARGRVLRIKIQLCLSEIKQNFKYHLIIYYNYT